MMRWLFKWLFPAVMVFACLLLRPSLAEETPLRLVIATDFHYFSPALTDFGEVFSRYMANGDGKAVRYISQITDCFVETMLAERPDAVILTGDLTLNGELKSHQELVSQLQRILDAGIPVWVIPGNHDIDMPQALAYYDTGLERVPSVSAAEFAALYGPFGLNDALSRDQQTLSYATRLASHHVTCIFGDVNTYGQLGSFTNYTLSWVVDQVKAAVQRGDKVLFFSHQNLLIHNPRFVETYRIDNADQLLHFLEKYDVRAAFSGHLHIQHIATHERLTEACTTALAVWPHQYACVTVEGSTLSYSTQPLDVEAYAAAHEAADEALLHFSAWSRAFFEQENRAAHRRASVTEEDRAINSYLSALNSLYFAGRLDLFERDPQTEALMAQVNDSSLDYLQSFYDHLDNQTVFFIDYSEPRPAD